MRRALASGVLIAGSIWSESAVFAQETLVKATWFVTGSVLGSQDCLGCY